MNSFPQSYIVVRQCFFFCCPENATSLRREDARFNHLLMLTLGLYHKLNSYTCKHHIYRLYVVKVKL